MESPKVVPRSAGSKWKRLRQGLGLLLLAAVTGGYLGAWALGRAQLRSAERAWMALGRDTAVFLSRHPPREKADETALALEELVAPLGIGLAPRGTARADAAPGGDGDLSRVGPFMASLLGSTAAELPDLPDELDSEVAEHAETLDRVVELLVAGPPPRWEHVVDRGLSGPVPRLSGQLELHGLLLARAIAQARAGRDDAAAAAFAASWALATDARSRPDLPVQRVAAAVAGWQAAVARRLPLPPAPWARRLTAHVHRASLLDAFQFMPVAMSRMAEDPDTLDPDLSFGDRVGLWFVRPYFLLTAGELSERQAEVVSLLQAAGPCADLGPELDAVRRAPRWSLFSQLALEPRDDVVAFVDRRADLQLELARRVLEARALAQRGGGSEADREHLGRCLCPGARWAVSIDADGGFSVRLEGGPPPLPARKVTPVLEHHEPAAR